MEVLAAAGGSLISSSIEAMVENLSSSELLKFISMLELIAEVENWETWLMEIKELLKDAEGKQTTDQRVKVWLDRLRDLAYDIEDVLDELSTEASKRRMAKESSHVPPSLEFKHEMASKMKDITERLQRITTQVQTLNLKTTAGEGPNKRNERPPTSSLVVQSHICGRNDDKEALIQMLQSHEGSSNPFSVIHILGMGGIGKTTLAQLVYNDYNVQVSFDAKVWVCVSENFDVVMLTRTILQTITGKNHEHLPFNSLQERLMKNLSQKRFLLILDDVWEEDYSQWDNLCKPFFAGEAGSKIVITARKDSVASMARDVPTYRVEGLPDDECLSLVAIHAVGAKNFDSHLNLKDSALEIVKRCKGLPLAAKVLGGLLRNKRSPQHWERVLRSETWNLPETSSSTPLAVLKLSYDDLPSHLKRCFVYCAIFPKDYEFDRDELVLLWMAEGFLQFPEGEERMEDLGIHYFDDLVSRSLFQSSSENQQKYVMHDLIHDLAQSMAGEFCYNYEKKINFNGEQSNSKLKKVRHASIRLGDVDNSQEYTVLTLMNSLRTVLCFPILKYVSASMHFASTKKLKMLGLPINWWYTAQFYNSVIGSKCLRVLSVTSPLIKSLPNSIGDLKHLRHLNLSCTSIVRLPDSVSSLINLLSLLLRSCKSLEKLPDKIENLIHLLHLDISDTPLLEEIPSSIGMLINLQTLPKFVVNESHGTTIALLSKLNNLRGILSIEALHNVTNLQDAKLANLKAKQGLEELVFMWKHRHHGGDDMSVLESLEPPHQNLKRLTIDSYGGSEFPSWVSYTSFSKLVSFNLRSCPEIKFLSALRNLCLLEVLEIYNCASLEGFRPDFKLPTSLKIFKIKDCGSLFSLPDGLITLDDSTNSCQSPLQYLSIIQCGKLTSFPCGKLLPTIKTLEIKECSSLVSFAHVGFPSSLEDLEISYCASLKYFGTDFNLPTLKIFKIRACPSLLSLPDGLMTLEDNANLYQSYLQDLSIIQCGKLTSFPLGKLPPTLKTLEIKKCSSLVSFAHVGFPSSLEDLKISDCASLKYFGTNFNLPALKIFKIRACPSLLSLPDGLMILEDNTNLYQSHLQDLSIIQCGKLTSFPPGKLPPTLKTLEIKECSSLVSFAHVGFPSSLEDLKIFDCASLKYFGTDFNLPTLKIFKIRACPSLLSLPDGLMILEDNTNLYQSHLQDLSIIQCGKLTSFPPGKLPPTLKTLEIKECSNLVSFAHVGFPSSLEDLKISDCASLKHFGTNFNLSTLKIFKIRACPSLLSLSDGLMMLEDNTNLYQSHLQDLSIIQCEKLTFFPPVKLPPTLKTLEIKECSSLVSFAHVGFPSSLEDLKISDCASLKYFGTNFNLSTLKIFKISACPNLLSLPDGLMTLKDNTNLYQSHLQDLSIIQCEKLTSFPPGKFPPTLKTLEIEGCSSLVSFAHVGFPSSLEDLKISDCASLKYFGTDFNLSTLKIFKIRACPSLLSLSDGLMMLEDNTNLYQSHLQDLSIIQCEKLTFFPPIKLPPTIKFLKIEGCSSLVSFAHVGFPSSLEDLEISDCASLKYFGTDINLPTLKFFKIKTCPSLVTLPDGLMMSEDNTNMYQSHLQDLVIIQCGQLTSFPPGKLPPTLKTLEIEGCSSLVSFAHVGFPSSLEDLKISDCASLKYFGTDFNLPTLKFFKIRACPSLLSLPDGLMTLEDNTNLYQSHLQYLVIIQCGQLTSFPPGKLPPTLKTLEIEGCSSLVSFAHVGFPSSLEFLKISDCASLEYFGTDFNLPTLKCFKIKACPSLLTLPDGLMTLEDNTNLYQSHLQDLVIIQCGQLTSFPLGKLPPTLKTLIIKECSSLESLTQGGGGLPKNLTSLEIINCENLRQPLTEWGLHLLSSLRTLRVEGICFAFLDVVSFLEENHCLLPTSLNRLLIGDFTNLESLGLGLRKLTCLCYLDISNCPKLQSLAKEALPSSLKRVSIRDCPLLEEHYLENQGEYPFSISFLTSSDSSKLRRESTYPLSKHLKH